MAKTQANCPRCRQPVLAEVNQIFDLHTDPLAKQKLLSGVVNFMHCPSCGFEGMLSLPIVYHDPEKELLLTFFPPELGVPINEQEKQLGALINRVLGSLPNDKKKAYLLQPQAMLTYQTLLEKILEADGITKEMLEEQQKRINLLQRLLTTPKPDQLTIVKQEEGLIDASFFALLSRLLQSAVTQQDEKTSKELAELQDLLFKETKVGKEIYTQAKETEDAIKSLQEAGKDGLSRDKLLDLILKAPSETQLTTLVSLARTGIDYSFFQLLSEKIDSAQKEEKQKLINLREKILKLTDEIDKHIQAEYDQVKQLLETIITSENIEQSVEKNLSKIDNLFIQVIENELAAARKKADLERISKLERIMIVVEKATEPPAEFKLIQELINTTSEEELQNKLQEHLSEITPEFLDLFNNIIVQSEGKNTDVKVLDKIKEVYRSVLRFSMMKNIKQ
jgi:hypothetical protein